MVEPAGEDRSHCAVRFPGWPHIRLEERQQQMAQNLCHRSPTKICLHFMHASTWGFRVGRSRFARSVIGQPRRKLTYMANFGP